MFLLVIVFTSYHKNTFNSIIEIIVLNHHHKRSQKVRLAPQIRSLFLQSIFFSNLTALLGKLVGILQASRHSHRSGPVVISIALVVGQLGKGIQWDLSTFIADFELDWGAASLLLTDIDTGQVELSVAVF